MSAGKILVAILAISAVAAGAGIYYTQVYAYYEDVAADAPAAQLRLTSVVSGEPETFIARDLTAIDKTSSPLGFPGLFHNADEHRTDDGNLSACRKCRSPDRARVV